MVQLFCRNPIVAKVKRVRGLNGTYRGENFSEAKVVIGFISVDLHTRN
jgi:hypothetical protein